MKLRLINTQLLTIFSVVLLTVGLVFLAMKVTSYVEQQTAISAARSHTQLLSSVQSFYSKNIASHAEDLGIPMSMDYRHRKELSLPYPATFLHDLVREMNTKEGKVKFTFSSPFPFMGREGSGLTDKFQERAWEVLARDEKNDFSLVENGMLHYARAIRMGESCVACHNSHKDSPRKNWQVGDLRGVETVTVPLGQTTFFSNSEFNIPTIIITGVYALFAVCFVLLILLGSKYKAQSDAKKAIETKNRALKDAGQQISKLAYVCSVTGLANRPKFTEEMNHAVSELNRNNTPFALLVIDLDNFKSINDNYGHVMGDDVLNLVGERIASAIDSTAFAARLSGDEFVVLYRRTINQELDLDTMRLTCERIIKNVPQPMYIDDNRLNVGVSIGVCLAPDHARTTEHVLTRADMALTEVKNAGKDGYLIYSDELQKNTERLLEVTSHFKQAFRNKEFRLHYQPKVNSADGSIRGFEALVRWDSKILGRVSPEEFLKIAVNCGMIHQLSNWIFRQAIADLAKLKRNGHAQPNISINVHPCQLRRPEEFKALLKSFETHGLDKKSVTLEITENCVIGRGTEHVPALLEELQHQGFVISLDDFGTGFASLTHVKSLPVKELKIDKEFIADLRNDSSSFAIVKMILSLSKSLGIEVVAEGVETREQLEILRGLGCNCVQGYFFSRALDHQQIDILLEAPFPFAEQANLPETISRLNQA